MGYPANFNQLSFIKSAAKLSQCPEDIGQEIAFVGRSNVGKSSALNAIANIKTLAKVSKTPGRTQLINFFGFMPTGMERLVDLPGYGYAKVSGDIVQQWQQFINEYLCARQSLRGLFLLIDIRRGILEGDQQMLEWCQAAKIPVHILLTKADKLSYGQAKSAKLMLERELQAAGFFAVSLQLFSALKKMGVEEAREKIVEWLHI